MEILVIFLLVGFFLYCAINSDLEPAPIRSTGKPSRGERWQDALEDGRVDFVPIETDDMYHDPAYSWMPGNIYYAGDDTDSTSTSSSSFDDDDFAYDSGPDLIMDPEHACLDINIFHDTLCCDSFSSSAFEDDSFGSPFDDDFGCSSFNDDDWS